MLQVPALGFHRLQQGQAAQQVLGGMQAHIGAVLQLVVGAVAVEQQDGGETGVGGEGDEVRGVLAHGEAPT
ncbi:hypothetical protein D3C80_2042650 [compost metagenome]